MMKYEDCLSYLHREEQWKRRNALTNFFKSIFYKTKVHSSTWHRSFLKTFTIPKQTLDMKQLHIESTKYMKKSIPKKIELNLISIVDDKVSLITIIIIIIIIVITIIIHHYHYQMKEIKRVKPWLGDGLGLEHDHHNDDDDDNLHHMKTLMKHKVTRVIENSMFVGYDFQPFLQQIYICGGLHHGVVGIIKYDDHNSHYPSRTLVDNISSSSSLSSSSSSSLSSLSLSLLYNSIDIIARTGFLAHHNLCDNNRKCFANIITTRNRYLSTTAMNSTNSIPKQELPSYSTIRMIFLNYFFYTIRYKYNESSIILIQGGWRRYMALKKYFNSEKMKLNNINDNVVVSSTSISIALSKFIPIQMFKSDTIEYEKKKDKSIILIQCIWRRWIAIRYVNNMRIIHYHNNSISFIIKIQCAWRISIAINHVKERRLIKNKTIKELMIDILKHVITSQAPDYGNSLTNYWINESIHVADHFAAGSIVSAINTLKSQISLANITPLKSNATTIFLGSVAYLPGLPLLPSTKSYLHRPTKKLKRQRMPSIALKVSWLFEQLMIAYQLFTKAKFHDSQSLFREIISAVPLVLATSVTELNDLKSILSISREYIKALIVMIAIQEESNVSRKIELAVYATNIKLQPAHNLLSLRFAMTTSYNEENYGHAAMFARRILQIPAVHSDSNANLKLKIESVLEKCEQKDEVNKFILSDYDEGIVSFGLDSIVLKPLYEGQSTIICPFCASLYFPENIGRLCAVCCISEIGGISSTGLIFQRPGSSIGLSRPGTVDEIGLSHPDAVNSIGLLSRPETVNNQINETK